METRSCESAGIHVSWPHLYEAITIYTWNIYMFHLSVTERIDRERLRNPWWALYSLRFCWSFSQSFFSLLLFLHTSRCYVSRSVLYLRTHMSADLKCRCIKLRVSFSWPPRGRGLPSLQHPTLLRRLLLILIRVFCSGTIIFYSHIRITCVLCYSSRRISNEWGARRREKERAEKGRTRKKKHFKGATSYNFCAISGSIKPK